MAVSNSQEEKMENNRAGPGVGGWRVTIRRLPAKRIWPPNVGGLLPSLQELYSDVALVVERISDSLLLSYLCNGRVFMFHFIWQP